MWIRFDIFIVPIFLSFKFLENAVSWDEGFQIFERIGKMDLGCNDGIQPSSNDFPDTCLNISWQLVQSLIWWTYLRKSKALYGVARPPRTPDNWPQSI
jgi:hypothetical protein